MGELVLSATSVEAYETCHYRWYLSYVESHAGEGSIAQAVGLAVHAGAETYLRHQMAGGPVEPGWTAGAIDQYDLTYVVEASEISEPEEDPVAFRKIGRRALVAYLEDVAPLRGTIMVEHAGRVDVNGIPFSYHVDRVTDVDEVLDLKVKKAKPRRPADHLFQLTGYALGFRADTGRIETDVGLDVMIRLKRDRPYLVPIRYGGPVSDRDIGIFASRLERTANGIEAGDFEPTGLDTDPLVCRWCPVRAVCDPYAEYLIITGGT